MFASNSRDRNTNTIMTKEWWMEWLLYSHDSAWCHLHPLQHHLEGQYNRNKEKKDLIMMFASHPKYRITNTNDKGMVNVETVFKWLCSMWLAALHHHPEGQCNKNREKKDSVVMFASNPRYTITNTNDKGTVNGEIVFKWLHSVWLAPLHHQLEGQCNRNMEKRWW